MNKISHKSKDKIQEFARKINVRFKNINLLKQAFVHRSFLNEHPSFKIAHNERLEFLGDAVLELITTEFLFHKFPKKPEGALTNIRASLVNSKSLYDAAEKLGVGEYLLLSHGEAKDKDTKARKYILANCMEAIIGAVYIDQGYKIATDFIQKNFLYRIEKIIENKLYMDPKTEFQERAQEIFNITPVYKLLNEQGPDHNKTFTVGLYLEEKLISKGIGSSKQEAEVEAAKTGMKKKGW